MKIWRAVAITAVLLVAAFGAGEAAAHPLGNFSVNHMTEVKVSHQRVEALYILDQAEVPTFQERGLTPGEVLARKRAEVARRLRLEVDGQETALRQAGAAHIEFPAGQGGLKVTRVEIPLVARTSDPRRVVLRDDTFAGRPGWKAIVAAPGDGTAVRSTAPSGDPTDGLRRYPEGGLDAPLDQRRATFAVRPGGGTLEAPESPGAGTTTTSREADGLTAVFSDAASGERVLILLLLGAFGWGALHALSPGHGKAMVAAYLIGTRGTARHAVGLGATVTITHTIGVFTLGLVTLLLSQYILPEDLFPWLTLVSGLLVVLVGIGVLRSRIRWARARRAHRHGQDHGHHHEHGHDHGHGHTHDHAPPERVTWKGLIAMGAAAGLIPCPSALVVLLGAIAQHQVTLGLLLILAFSAGLAMTLTALGLTVVFGRRALSRLRVPAGVATALPALSAMVIVGVGFVLTAQAVPQLT
jgi:ABC-type nickel/cobalt efflux system permease component RcnA